MGEIMSILHDLCQCHSTKTSHFLQRIPQTHSFTSYSFHDQVYNHPIQQPINYVVCSVEIQQCSLNIGNEYVKMFSICFICKPSLVSVKYHNCSYIYIIFFLFFRHPSIPCQAQPNILYQHFIITVIKMVSIGMAVCLNSSVTQFYITW